MAADAVLSTLGHAWQFLDSVPIRKAVFGGLALSAWDHARSTKDVDILFDPAGLPLHAILAELGSAGFRAKGRSAVIRLDDAEFIQVLYEPPEAFMQIQVDLLIASSEFDSQALSRSVELPVPELGRDLTIVRCEDLIVMKLRAGRLIDRADVAALLRANRDSLNLDHLSNWLVHFKLQRKFRESWSEAFPNESSPVCFLLAVVGQLVVRTAPCGKSCLAGRLCV